MRWRSLAAIVLAAGLGAGISAAGTSTRRSGAAKPAKIVYVNVGQADGVLMRIGGDHRLRTGEHFPEHMDETLHALRRSRSTWRPVACARGPRQDTIRLIRDFGWTIKLAVLSDSALGRHGHESELIDLLREKKMPRVIATRGQTFDWSSASWRNLNPPVHEFTPAVHHRQRTIGRLPADVERHPGALHQATSSPRSAGRSRSS